MSKYLIVKQSAIGYLTKRILLTALDNKVRKNITILMLLRELELRLKMNKLTG